MCYVEDDPLALHMCCSAWGLRVFEMCSVCMYIKEQCLQCSANESV